MTPLQGNFGATSCLSSSQQSTRRSQPAAYNRQVALSDMQQKCFTNEEFNTLMQESAITPNVILLKQRAGSSFLSEESSLVGKRIERESDEDCIHLYLNHKNISKAFGYYILADCRILIMRSYIQSLESKLCGAGVDFNRRLNMNRDVMSGLDYLHNTAEIIHSDLAIKNIFVGEHDSLVIGDFGLSDAVGESRPFSEGTVCPYLSPELSEPELCVASKESDCCSAGLVALSILINKVSYNLWATPNAIKSGELNQDGFKEDYLKFQQEGEEKVILPQLYASATDLLNKHGDEETRANTSKAERCLTEIIFPLMKRDPNLRKTVGEVKQLIEKLLAP